MKEIYSVLPGVPDFDESKFRLGALCKRGHNWNNTGYSLRRSCKGGGCVECGRLHQANPKRQEQMAAWREANRVEQNEKARKRMNARYHDESLGVREYQRQWKQQRHATIGRETRSKGLNGLVVPPGCALDVPRARIARQLVADGQPLEWDVLAPLIDENLALEGGLKAAGQSPTVADLVSQEQEQYWKANPQSHAEHVKRQKRLYIRWKMLTDPEYVQYHRQKSKRRKLLLKERTALHIPGRVIDARHAEFDYSCAYCGFKPQNKLELETEHVIPIKQGGTHALGNLLPTCESCNDSKYTYAVEEWYRQQPFFSETRWRKICRVLGWSRSSVGQMALL
jgi:5-methylcytosine-specific restriction endonuclease McrA